MLHSRKEELDSSVAPPFQKVQPGDLYLGMLPYPKEFFPVQEYFFGLGANPEHLDTNLVHALQGVEYLLDIANGDTPLTVDNVSRSMRYADIKKFENGALRQFPEFWNMIKDALLKLQKGREVLDIVRSIEEYTDLP